MTRSVSRKAFAATALALSAALLAAVLLPAGSQICTAISTLTGRRRSRTAPRASPSCGRSGGTEFQIFTMRSDGTDVRQITKSSSVRKQQPDWSPDGAKLAYVCGKAICINDAGGGNEYVFSDRGRDRNPHWSPDRKFILYDSPDQYGMQKIFVAAVARSSFKQLTPSNNLVTDREPDWSPDGTQITLISDRVLSTPQVFRMKADRSGVSQVTTSGYNIQPDW